MKLDSNGLRLSATDLAQHLGCPHLTQLDRAAAEGRLDSPIWTDPVLEMLKQRGIDHETAYAKHLADQGLSVAEVGCDGSVDRVVELMRAGTDVILQAPLADGRFAGIADFLRKVSRPSELGDFSYEVIDTKLALETRAGTILQLCMYTEAVGKIQGHTPEYMHVVKPGEEFEQESFRTADIGAYFRLIKAKLEAVAAAAPDEETYPTPVPQCSICRWWHNCDARRREDDHLSLVAGMSTLHAAEFTRQGVRTLTQLGEASEPLKEKPARGSAGGFDRLHAQARIQLQGRQAGEHQYELLDLEGERGLLRLPEPSPGDIFFDIEAARFYEGGGLEYLLGWSQLDDQGQLVYHRRWGYTRAQEKRAFEEFVDVVIENWRAYPGMHVYHFAPYEPSALKRLMGRHGCRGEEVDRLLRGKRLIDLHAVAKQGLRASVEQYSLKDLEMLAGFERGVDLREASRARRRIEALLDLGDVDGIADADRATVEGYNREDCEATAVLRDWLEGRRQEWLDRGQTVPRPELLGGEAPESVSEMRADVQEVYDSLMSGLPQDREAWTQDHRGTWLLAEMLEYYRRELNSAWWEFFRLHDLDADEILEERKAVGGLEFIEAVGGTTRCPIHRYRFSRQECAVDEGDELYECGNPQGAIGTVDAVSLEDCTIDIKKRGSASEVHPVSIMVKQIVPAKPKDASLLAFARSVVADGIDGDGPFRAGRAILLGRPPLVDGHAGGPLRSADEPMLDAARRVVGNLSFSYLPIQGPPGTGKTFTGARMIVDLARKGKRIGVTAVSHKVIRNLLDAVHEASTEDGDPVSLAHKISSRSSPVAGAVLQVRTGDEALAALDVSRIVGATAWLWSADSAEETLDYLFVDEAGQMALADVLAVSRAAKNIVLLGDPQQLEQPQQGAHPEGTEVAALVHILGGNKTIPEDRGLFLDTTWRLHPSICKFTSELYYEGRLHPIPGTEQLVIAGPTSFSGSGLFVAPMDHEGNQSSSPEEVSAVERIVSDLLQEGVTWTDRNGVTRPLELDDILIVTPYNAQLAALKRALPDHKVGTVDKFQGQEAPVVIYSMASSSPEDAPRGMGFLYNPNRLNVATSRARAACILVASSRLFEPECRSPQQMRWANGLCRYAELAKRPTMEVTQ